MDELTQLHQPPMLQDGTVKKSLAKSDIYTRLALAHSLPRNEEGALLRIKKMCGRKTVADKSFYTFKVGYSEVTGPSVYLAKEIALKWGHIDYGVQIIKRTVTETTALAYAFDFENHVSKSYEFVVPHIRYSKKNGKTTLNDPKEIEWAVSAQGSKHLRNAILDLIPADIMEDIKAACEKTLMSNTTPIKDRVSRMLEGFDSLGVSIEMIEKRLKHKVQAINERELLDLGRIYNTIKDGYSDRKEYFEIEETVQKPAKPVKKVERPKNNSKEDVLVAEYTNAINNLKNEGELAALVEKLGKEKISKENIKSLHSLLDVKYSEFKGTPK